MGRYKDAAVYAKQGLAAARKSTSANQIQQLSELVVLAERLVGGSQGVEDARKTLAAKPDDPAANRFLGRELALVQGDVAAATAHLVKSGDPELAKIGQLEAEGPTRAEGRVALGDAWRELAASEARTLSPEGIAAAKTARLRAVFWYKLALSDLPNESRAAVQARIREVEK